MGYTTMSLRVAVGSANPVKIGAVQMAFESVWPEQQWEIRGVSVPSHVSDQPMNDQETMTGARNRASNALLALPDAAYSVGLEGGLQQIGSHWFDCGWVVVLDRDGHEGVGASVKLPIPTRMMEMIWQGMELGEAVDAVAQQRNSGQSFGHYGLMTKNVLTRQKAYGDGVIAALSCFIRADLFLEAALMEFDNRIR